MLVASHVTLAQDVIGLDPLMKAKHVQVKTQYECNRKGKKCQVLFQWSYDRLGRLEKNASFSMGQPFMIATYNYNEFDKVDSVYRRFAHATRYLSQAYGFDDRGNTTEYFDCFSDTPCTLSQTREYNRTGFLIRQIEFKNGRRDTETIYRYDDSGNNVEMLVTYSSGTTVTWQYSYDIKNNKVLSVNFGPNGERLDSTTFKYNERGQLTHLNWMGGLNTGNVYTYDNEGNELEYRSIDPQGQLTDRRVWTYKDGLEETRTHYKEGKTERYFRFDYERY